MTLPEALAITNIREDELNRINLKAIDFVIEDTKRAMDKDFDPYGHHRKYIEALETIKKEVEK